MKFKKCVFRQIANFVKRTHYKFNEFKNFAINDNCK